MGKLKRRGNTGPTGQMNQPDDAATMTWSPAIVRRVAQALEQALYDGTVPGTEGQFTREFMRAAILSATSAALDRLAEEIAKGTTGAISMPPAEITANTSRPERFIDFGRSATLR